MDLTENDGKIKVPIHEPLISTKKDRICNFIGCRYDIFFSSFLPFLSFFGSSYFDKVALKGNKNSKKKKISNSRRRDDDEQEEIKKLERNDDESCLSL